MKLITKAVLKEFDKHKNDKDTGNPWIVCKFFNPCGGFTWYATEFDQENGIITNYMTGGDFDEWGSIFLSDLEKPLPPLGLPCERDLYFTPCYFEDLKEKGIIKERVY
jgi:hypothetical protein